MRNLHWGSSQIERDEVVEKRDSWGMEAVGRERQIGDAAVGC